MSKESEYYQNSPKPIFVEKGSELLKIRGVSPKKDCRVIADELYQCMVELIEQLKPNPEEVVSAKEYLEKEAGDILDRLGPNSRLALLDVLTDFSKQDNHTRIERDLKTQAELMEEVVKLKKEKDRLNNVLTDLILTMGSKCHDNEIIIKNGHNFCVEWKKKHLSQSETPESYQKQDEWISATEQHKLPSGGLGNWDGKKSDLVLTITDDGLHDVCRVYYGFMDGSDFINWYDRYDMEIKGVIKWQPLPNAPKK